MLVVTVLIISLSICFAVLYLNIVRLQKKAQKQIYWNIFSPKPFQGLKPAVARLPEASRILKTKFWASGFNGQLEWPLKKSHKYSHFLSQFNSTFDFKISYKYRTFFIEYPFSITHKTEFTFERKCEYLWDFFNCTSGQVDHWKHLPKAWFKKNSTCPRQPLVLSPASSSNPMRNRRCPSASLLPIYGTKFGR